MRKKISLALILVLMLSVISVPVFAKDDNFYADDEVTLEKNIGKTTFVAGDNIEVTSEIDGASFIAGNNITLSSQQDYLFTRNGKTSKSFRYLISITNINIHDHNEQ